MTIVDYIRQLAMIVVGALILIYDLVSSGPHDWVTILLGLGLMGAVPIEYALKSYNGHGSPSSGSSSTKTTGNS